MKNIFNRLRKNVEQNPASITADEPASPAVSFMPSTPVLREAITSFIVQSLQPYVDEKGLSIAGLQLYIACESAEQEEAARVALYTDRPGVFKATQLERQLLNHFIQLDEGWFFECHLVAGRQLPDNCMRKFNFGLQVVRAGERVAGRYAKVMIEVLAGQTQSTSYMLDPQLQLKYYVGRTHSPQLASGKMQRNDIVFLGPDEPGFNEASGSPNLHVSRNHAYILYDPGTDHWLLFADNGGLPENGNKLKVHTTDDKVKWLNIAGVAHRLCHGDQVELGGAAVLRFNVDTP